MKGFFIAGTDTGVGKTEVARALCAALARARLRPIPLKPFETGCAPDAPQDALALRAACGPDAEGLSLDRICPHRFRLPAAPLVAAEAEGRAVDLQKVESLTRQAQDEGRVVVVEAAGGLLVPLAREVEVGSLEQVDPAKSAPVTRMVTNLDLAERLGLPVLLVGRAGLGTLNHCALSAEALTRRRLTVVAIVLNRAQRVDDPTVATNAAFVAELTGQRVLGPTPFVADPAERMEELAAFVEPLLAARAR